MRGGEGRGAGRLTTCAVMSANARRGERRGESGAGRGERAFRLEGGGSPVDTDDERRFIIVVVNNDKRCLMDGIVSYISAADVWWPSYMSRLMYASRCTAGTLIHQHADVRIFFPYIVGAGSFDVSVCASAIRVNRTQSVNGLTATVARPAEPQSTVHTRWTDGVQSALSTRPLTGITAVRELPHISAHVRELPYINRLMHGGCHT